LITAGETGITGLSNQRLSRNYLFIQGLSGFERMMIRSVLRFV
jgi:hypothetical protein